MRFTGCELGVSGGRDWLEALRGRGFGPRKIDRFNTPCVGCRGNCKGRRVSGGGRADLLLASDRALRWRTNELEAAFIYLRECGDGGG